MKRYFAALAIGGVVFGTVLASAADLGTVGDGTLGSATGVVATCQNGTTNPISADYVTAWDATDKRYEVTDVQLNGLDLSCDNKAIRIALVNDADANVSETDGLQVVDVAADDSSQTFDVDAGTNEASVLEVTGIRVTIYGE